MRANVYVTDGPNILSAASVAGNGAAMTMQGVTYYIRSDGGTFVERITAPVARYANPGWRLEQAQRFEVQGANSTRVPAMVVARGVTPQQIELAKVEMSEKIDKVTTAVGSMAAGGAVRWTVVALSQVSLSDRRSCSASRSTSPV